MFICRRNHDACIHQLGHKGVRRYRRNPERTQDVRWKVSAVEGYDHVCDTGQGGSQHVSVIGVGQCQPLLPALVTPHATPEDVPAHQPTGSLQVPERYVRPLAPNGSNPLPMNPARPFHSQEPLPPAVDC